MKSRPVLPLLQAGMVWTFIAFCGTEAAPFAGSAFEAQVVIYVEAPARSTEEITLVPGVITLVGNSSPIELEPIHPAWESAQFGGRQVRCFEQTIPAGIFESLHLVFERVELRVGPATVHPTPAPEGISVPLDLRIEAGECELILLRWIPQPLVADQDTYRPEFHLIESEVPPLGSLAFVSNEGSGNLTVIDRSTLKVVDVVMVGDEPRGLAYSRSNQRLYIALKGSSEIASVDALSRRIIRRIPLGFGDEPSRLLLSDDESTLFVLNYRSNSLSVLSAWSLQELMRFPLGERPRALAQDRLSGFLYVSSELAGEILVFDPVQGAQVSTLSVDSSPAEILFNERERRIYLSSTARRRLLVLDAGTGASSAHLNLCSPATGLAFNPISRRLYAATGACQEIAISRPSRQLELGSISLPGAPGLLTFDSEFKRLLVTLPDRHQIAICNANSRRLIALIDVGSNPYMVVVP